MPSAVIVFLIYKNNCIIIIISNNIILFIYLLNHCYSEWTSYTVFTNDTYISAHKLCEPLRKNKTKTCSFTLSVTHGINLTKLVEELVHIIFLYSNTRIRNAVYQLHFIIRKSFVIYFKCYLSFISKLNCIAKYIYKNLINSSWITAKINRYTFTYINFKTDIVRIYSCRYYIFYKM